VKHFKVGLCFIDEEGDVVANKVLKSPWDVTQDEVRLPCPLIRNEIATILTEAIKREVTVDNIKEMLDEMKGD